MKYKFVEDIPKPVRHCLRCGKVFNEARGGKKYCNFDCRMEAYKPIRKESAKRSYQRRKANKPIINVPADMSDLDKEVVIALAENNMNESKTGRALFMSRHTVEYYEARIKQITGLDPTNFYDLHKLVEMARKKDGYVQI